MTNNPQLSDCCKAPTIPRFGCNNFGIQYTYEGINCTCTAHVDWLECTICRESCGIFVEEKKSIVEWAKDDGFIIVDPDGFDRTDPEVMTRLRTREEFMEGFDWCTIRPTKKIVEQQEAWMDEFDHKENCIRSGGFKCSDCGELLFYDKDIDGLIEIARKEAREEVIGKVENFYSTEMSSHAEYDFDILLTKLKQL